MSKKKTDLPIKKKQRELGNLRVPDDEFGSVAEYYPFSKQHLDFLIEYHKDCDFDRALKAVGVKAVAATKQNYTDKNTPLGRAMLREMQTIQADWLASIKLNAPAAARKHLELMQKFEDDYDGADLKNQNKGSLAGTLARMSDTSLKATGQLSGEKIDKGLKVEINIDLSGKQEEQLNSIDAEVIENGE